MMPPVATYRCGLPEFMTGLAVTGIACIAVASVGIGTPLVKAIQHGRRAYGLRFR